jgi:hypothetical protein
MMRKTIIDVELNFSSNLLKNKTMWLDIKEIQSGKEVHFETVEEIDS